MKTLFGLRTFVRKGIKRFNVTIYKMFYRLFFIFLSFDIIEALRGIKIIEENSTVNHSSILKCAKAIGELHFLQPQNVEIISQERLRRSGFEEFAAIVVRNNSDFRYPDFRQSLTKYAIIFLTGIHREEDLKILSALSQSDPQGRFVVSITKMIVSKCQRKEYLDRIISYLASIERWRVVILMKETGNEQIRMYTYAMRSSNSCKGVPELVDNGNCDNATTLKKKLFPVFINFHKCPVKLSTINYPPYSIIYDKNGENRIRGIEANVVNIIVEKLNATSQVFNESRGTAMRDNVRRRKTDLSYGAFLQFQIPGTTWSQSYLFAQTMIVIPQNLVMPLWMNLILPYRIEVWTTLGILISLPAVVKLMIPQVRRQFHLEWMLSGFFGIGITTLPTRLYQRLYVFSWIIIGYIIMQCYSASLTGFFASPGRYKQMQTLSELDKSNIVIGGLENWRNQFARTYPRISRDWKVLSEAEYFENLAKLKESRRGIASFGPTWQILNVTHGQESNFIVIPEYIILCPVSILLPNSSIILESSNRVILRICQAGFIQFWIRCSVREIEKDFASRDDNSSNGKTSLAFLEAPIFILFVGQCLGTIVFVLELIANKFAKPISTG